MKDSNGTEIKVGDFILSPHESVCYTYVVRPQYILVLLLETERDTRADHFSLNDSAHTAILDRSLFTPINFHYWTQDEKMARLAWLNQECPDLN